MPKGWWPRIVKKFYRSMTSKLLWQRLCMWFTINVGNIRIRNYFLPSNSPVCSPWSPFPKPKFIWKLRICHIGAEEDCHFLEYDAGYNGMWVPNLHSSLLFFRLEVVSCSLRFAFNIKVVKETLVHIDKYNSILSYNWRFEYSEFKVVGIISG
jgi:hypothetical protein